MRTLGKTGIAAPRIGLGCVTFGREIGERAAFAVMDYAVERGINLFDTAEAYGAGQARAYRRTYLGIDDQRESGSEMHSSEKIIGRWLRSNGARGKIVLVTKMTSNFSRAHVREALAQSLERLQTDSVDAYLFHAFDPETPVEESLAAIDEAVASGGARAAGCSNYTAAQLHEALAASRRLGLRRFEVTEPVYNLLAREIESDLLPFCGEQKIGVLGYSPLGAGFLAGKYTQNRSALPKGTRFDVIPGHADVYFSDRNFRIVKELHRMAARIGLPAVRLAMAWALRRPEITTVLVGARTTAHLDNALAAAETELRPEWLEEIDRWGAA